MLQAIDKLGGVVVCGKPLEVSKKMPDKGHRGDGDRGKGKGGGKMYGFDSHYEDKYAKGKGYFGKGKKGKGKGKGRFGKGYKGERRYHDSYGSRGRSHGFVIPSDHAINFR